MRLVQCPLDTGEHCIAKIAKCQRRGKLQRSLVCYFTRRCENDRMGVNRHRMLDFGQAVMNGRDNHVVVSEVLHCLAGDFPDGRHAIRVAAAMSAEFASCGRRNSRQSANGPVLLRCWLRKRCRRLRAHCGQAHDQAGATDQGGLRWRRETATQDRSGKMPNADDRMPEQCRRWAGRGGLRGFRPRVRFQPIQVHRDPRGDRLRRQELRPRRGLRFHLDAVSVQSAQNLSTSNRRMPECYRRRQSLTQLRYFEVAAEGSPRRMTARRMTAQCRADPDNGIITCASRHQSTCVGHSSLDGCRVCRRAALRAEPSAGASP